MSEGIVEKKVGTQVVPNPSVSIIIPNYNTASYICETLDSVFAQTFPSLEVIVINDASPDTEELCRVLAPYLDRIVFIEKAANEGTSATRNLAVKHANAPVIAFLDADDIWMPTYLEELYRFMVEGEYEMAYTDSVAFVSGRAGSERDLSHLNPAQGSVTRRMLIEGRCHILPSGTLIRKDVFEAIGGFDPGVRRTEDFDLWMRLLFNGTQIGYLRRILFKFRLSPESGSGDSVTRIERLRDVWLILREKLPFTDEENLIIDRHIAETDAAILRAKGHRSLVEKDWQTAREMFLGAARIAHDLGFPLSHRVRMRAVCLLLRLHPPLVLRLFKKLRPTEFEFARA